MQSVNSMCSTTAWLNSRPRTRWTTLSASWTTLSSVATTCASRLKPAPVTTVVRAPVRLPVRLPVAARPLVSAAALRPVAVPARPPPLPGRTPHAVRALARRLPLLRPRLPRARTRFKQSRVTHWNKLNGDKERGTVEKSHSGALADLVLNKEWLSGRETYRCCKQICVCCIMIDP